MCAPKADVTTLPGATPLPLNVLGAALSRLRGRSLILLGDSVSLQMWQALLWLLERSTTADPSTRATLTCPSLALAYSHMESLRQLQCARVRWRGAWVRVCYAKAGALDVWSRATGTNYTLADQLASLAASGELRACDLLIANSGLHYVPPTTTRRAPPGSSCATSAASPPPPRASRDFRATAPGVPPTNCTALYSEHLRGFLRELARLRVHGGAPQVIWRETSPFVDTGTPARRAGPWGANAGANVSSDAALALAAQARAAACDEAALPVPCRQCEVAERILVGEGRLAVLRVFAASRSAGGYLGWVRNRDGEEVLDCAHRCVDTSAVLRGWAVRLLELIATVGLDSPACG